MASATTQIKHRNTTLDPDPLAIFKQVADGADTDVLDRATVVAFLDALPQTWETVAPGSEFDAYRTRLEDLAAERQAAEASRAGLKQRVAEIDARLHESPSLDVDDATLLARLADAERLRLLADAVQDAGVKVLRAMQQEDQVQQRRSSRWAGNVLAARNALSLVGSGLAVRRGMLSAIARSLLPASNDGANGDGL